jgi:ribonucleoside-diphosphate reductase alpha chain
MTKAFLAVNGGQGAASARVRELVENLTATVVTALIRRQPAGGTFHIEDIQDQVELALMRSGEHDVARAYVLYRAKHQEERQRALEAQRAAQAELPTIHLLVDGERVQLDIEKVRALITAACVGLDKLADAEAILTETLKNLYDGVPVEELHKSAILAARALMEKEPAYSQVTSRLLLHTVRKEVFGKEVAQADATAASTLHFPQFIQKGIDAELLDPRWRSLIWIVWQKHWCLNVICNSAISVCRLCMTVISCMSAAPVLKCRRHFICAWRWVWRWKKRS